MSSLEQLLRIPSVDSSLRFSISSDEKEIIFSWNKSGKWELWRLEIGELGTSTGSAQRIRELGGEIIGSKFSPKHSPDGKQLAYVVDYDGSESYHIYLHNPQNNSHISLTDSSGYAQQPNFDFSPDGKTLAILSDQSGSFALYLLDIETKEKKLLLDIHRPIWDVTWSPDGKYIAVEAEAKASDREIYIVGVESGTLRQGSGQAWKVLSENDETLNAQHPTWSSDSKHLIFSCENGEWHNIGLYDVETEKITWVTESIGDDTQPTTARSGEIIGWIHSVGASTNFQFKKRGGQVKQVKVGDGVHSFPRIVSGDVILIYEDVNHPPDLWKINLESGEATQLTKSSDVNFDFVQPEEIFYDDVPALLFRGKNNFTVIDIHGGPNWHVQNMWNPFVSEMVARGWNVLQPNYRGSTGYGKKWQNASRYDMGGVDADDCAAGVKYLMENKIANKFVVTGRSHGGFLTMCCLTNYPDLFAGGSAVVPFLNWIKSHYESREDLQHWNIENMGDPETNKELWIKRSPYFFLDKVNAPVQMICGGNDPRCPASDSLDARDKLIELGKEVELLLYEDEGHSFLKMENSIDSEMKRIEFLEKCFGGRVG